jgi:hypothetical protein
MTKIEGSGSVSQRHGSADPDPDPPQNDMDPQHWLRIRNFTPGSRIHGQKDSRIRIKEFKYFKPKKLYLSPRKYDPAMFKSGGGQKGTRSRTRIRKTGYKNINFFLKTWTHKVR